MINDENRPVQGSLTIALDTANGVQVEHKTTKFFLAPLGQQTYYVDFPVPQTTGKFLLEAIAETTGGQSGSPTRSRRRVSVVEDKQNTN